MANLDVICCDNSGFVARSDSVRVANEGLNEVPIIKRRSTPDSKLHFAIRCFQVSFSLTFLYLGSCRGGKRHPTWAYFFRYQESPPF